MKNFVTDCFVPSAPLKTAVLFLVFNRPDTTAQVFESIRQAKPPRLYVAADGAREGLEGEREKVESVRKIATNIDWPCEVKTLFREENLGCRHSVSDAITWFFENEEQGVILEDDCVPSQSFFWFCEDMLTRYKDDTRIWQVSGTTFFPEAISQNGADYFFTRYGPIWGWASWRRAWKYYDVELTDWPEMKRPANMENVYPDQSERIAKRNIGERLYSQDFDTWDFQWAFVKAYNNALTVLPTINQIVNIGFGQEATHTINKRDDEPSCKYEMSSEIKHPLFIIPDRMYEQTYARKKFAKPGFMLRVFNKLQKVGVRVVGGD